MKKIYLLREQELMHDYVYLVKYRNTWSSLRFDSGNKCFFCHYTGDNILLKDVQVYSLPE